MGTPCRVFLVEDDGSILSSVFTKDGYPDYTGEILVEHYSDKDKLRSLLERGEASCIEPNPDDIFFYSNPSEKDWDVQSKPANHQYGDKYRLVYGEFYSYLYDGENWYGCDCQYYDYEDRPLPIDKDVSPWVPFEEHLKRFLDE